MKTCKKCGETKEDNEFYSDPSRPCIACRKIEAKERYALRKDYYTRYRETNKEAIKQRIHKYYEANKDAIKLRVKKWAAQNPDRVKAAAKRFHEKHTDYEIMNSREDRKNLKNHYVKSLLTKQLSIEEVPQALIEAKRLQILIRRRVEDEERNTVKR